MNYKEIERETYTWINICRTNPKGIIPELQSLLNKFTVKSFYNEKTKKTVETAEVKYSLYNFN